jgi:hypothetical protein
MKVRKSEDVAKIHKPLPLTALQNITSTMLKWASSILYLQKYLHTPEKS